MVFCQIDSEVSIISPHPLVCSKGANNILKLILHLVLNSETEELRTERESKVADKMVTKLSSLVGACLKSDMKDEMSRLAHVSIVMALRTLETLLLRRDPFTDGDRFVSSCDSEPATADADGDLSAFGTKSKIKTDPRFVCDVHGVPAVRRRCSSGQHKDRRFYVCGQKREKRCKYFKWADEEGGSKDDIVEDSSHFPNVRHHVSPTDASAASSTVPFKAQQRKSLDISDTNTSMQAELWKLFSVAGERGALQAQLCDLIQATFTKSEKSTCSISFNTPSPKKLVTSEDSSSQNKTGNLPCLESLQTDESVKQDWQDGVMVSKEKLGPLASSDILSARERITARMTTRSDSLTNFDERESSLVQAALDLLSNLAPNSLRSTQSEENSINERWSTGWFSLLCEIISTTRSSSHHQRAQAKRMLKRLCGGRRTTYHRVRDHYVFAFQFRNLLHHCSGPLQAAMDVRERAKRCGVNWRRAKEVTWSTLKAGDLLGIEGLISEDSLPILDDDRLKQVLHELLEVTKSRGCNWRQFCAMEELPHTQKGTRRIGLISGGDDDGKEIEQTRPPMFLLFWMACSLSGSNQVKIFHLIDTALTVSDENVAVPTKTSGDKGAVHTAEESGGVLSTDGGNTDAEPSGEKRMLADQSHSPSSVRSRGEALTPEHVLINRVDGLTAANMVSFVMQFVLRGKTVELRVVTSKVAEKIFHNLSDNDLNSVFLRLMGTPLREIGPLGRSASEFLQLMHTLVRDFGSNQDLQFSKVARSAVECFVQQMRVMSMDFYGGVGEEAGVMEIETEPGKILKKRFDLNPCVQCHSQKAGSVNNDQSIATTPGSSSENSSQVNSSTSRSSHKSATTSASPSSTTTGAGASTSSAKSNPSSKEVNNIPWLAEQVRPFSKGRLDTSTERVVSTEFASHVQLKFRLAISEVHLSVTDPRGRLVKKIGISFSPRQVGNVNDLKSIEYADIWQQCGTLSLARGSVRASCILKTPVVAANLKFEYLEFYEKVGGSRSSDGGLLLTCPRCTRVVNNAHGVCGHCGEVAFQCRKCRHINYDRLDAFLCVECGYCASGGFAYEVTAGIASNAVAIVDDDGFDRAVKLLRVAMKRLGEMRSGLRKKLLIAAVSKRKSSCLDIENLDDLNKYSPALKRALSGDLPKSSGKGGGDGGGGESSKRRSVSSISASRRSDQSRMTAANKARSLLSLARQLRNEIGSGGIDSDRPGRGDMLVRQALLNAGNTGGSIEFFDDGALCDSEGDMFGIYNAGSGSILHGDLPDPLSRLVANIQARVRSSVGGGGGGGGGNDNGGDGKKSGGSSGSSGEGGSSQQSPQAQMEECDRLHQQMREAERECFELQKTVNAWNRLNRDSLAHCETTISTSSFIPTSCSACAGKITLHYLVLAMAILNAGSEDVDGAVTEDFIQCLFEEPQGLSGELNKLKRLAIVTVAVQSNTGARLILAELRTRLGATRDVASAEILGTLLEKDFSLSDDYAKLAIEVMSGERMIQ